MGGEDQGGCLSHLSCYVARLHLLDDRAHHYVVYMLCVRVRGCEGVSVSMWGGEVKACSGIFTLSSYDRTTAFGAAQIILQYLQYTYVASHQSS